MEITIRAAVPDDAPAISGIITASWKAAYAGMIPQEYLDRLDENDRTLRFRKNLSDGTLKAAALFENDIPAGAVGYGKSRDQSLPDWGEVACLYVHPKFFRKGYGTKLLSEAMKGLKESGYRGCFLWVLAENKNAQAFYTAMGFERTEDTCHSEIGGERQTEVRYRIHLNQAGL